MKHIFLLTFCKRTGVLLIFFLAFLIPTPKAQHILLNDTLYISEFLAVNDNILQDEDGDYSDWIEIYNPTPYNIDLLGWHLTDDVADPVKWTFPQMVLPAGSYLVVFASGKDRKSAIDSLHTNFRLSGSGEYLALIQPDNITVTTSFGESFPAQQPDISFGVLDSSFVFFSSPTPGLPNGGDADFPEPVLNKEHGYFSVPFMLEMTTPVIGDKLYYTLNAGTPDTTQGFLYTEPFEISSSTIVRAAVIRNGITGRVVTRSYIFPTDIIEQADTQSGYPQTWGEYWDFAGTAIADYGMDPEIVIHPDYADRIIPSLQSLPVISLVSDISNLFSHTPDPDSGGIYIYTGPYDSFGSGWERPASCELFFPDQFQEGFSVACGLRIQGGASRQAEKTPKHSFRITFRDEYGPTRLEYPIFAGEQATDDFNTLIFRAAYGNSWRHFSPEQRTRAQHLRDPWAKDTQREMGYISAHNRFVHLYLNGMYWGVYNISERLDREFMQSYYGGNDEDFDVIKDYGEVAEGNSTAWSYLWNTVNDASIADNEVYFSLIGKDADGKPDNNIPAFVDPENLIDYILLNFYGGNNDWDHHNWVAARNRIDPGKGFQFFCWDTEKILENLNENYVNENNSNRPSGIFKRLLQNEEFRILFADRVNILLKHGGLLTPDSVIARYQRRADEIELAMIAESARWGDYRRDVHNWMSPPYELYTLDDHWMLERDRLVKSYFPERTNILIRQLENANLLPDVASPVFDPHGGDVGNGFYLYITAEVDEIWYTTDGTDPRMTGGAISPSAQRYDDYVSIWGRTLLQARAKENDSWSGLTSALFNPESEPISVPQVITENIFLEAQPNPFHDRVHIKVENAGSGAIVLKVHSVDGRLVSLIPQDSHDTGKIIFTWEPVNLDPGMYFITAEGSNFSRSIRVIYAP